MCSILRPKTAIFERPERSFQTSPDESTKKDFVSRVGRVDREPVAFYRQPPCPDQAVPLSSGASTSFCNSLRMSGYFWDRYLTTGALSRNFRR